MTVRQWHLTGGRHLDGGTGTLTRERPATVPPGAAAAGAALAGEAPAASRGARRLGVIGLALVLIAFR